MKKSRLLGALCAYLVILSFNENTDLAELYFGHYLVMSPVPIPPAIWLFGSGLPALVGMARKKTA